MSATPDKTVPQTPRHIAVIMDGNGRWANQHAKPRFSGHRAGVKSARKIVEACAQAGVEVLTLFAFSSENWNRPAEEVNALMRLFVEVLQREVNALHENGIRLRFIGARQNLPTILQKRIDDAEQKTAGNSRMQLVLAVAFGGRWDIVEAVRKLAAKAKAGEIDPDDIDETVVGRHVSLAGLPDPDLLIRTGGEKRVSNFLLWDFAYTEIWFTDTLWPEFDEQDLADALNFYGGRERRFGRVGDLQKKAGAD
ncbi:MAG: isoprenyl transferase [Gammaproteobacteria bacterium]